MEARAVEEEAIMRAVIAKERGRMSRPRPGGVNQRAGRWQRSLEREASSVKLTIRMILGLTMI